MDQAIAFGGGRVRETGVVSMLGIVAQDRIRLLLQGLADGDGAALLAQVAEMADLTPDFGAALQELLVLLHRVALLQALPEGAPGAEQPDPALVELAGRIAAEDVQLFYQVGLIGQRDLPLAPDPRSGFEMVLLRMLTFRPDGVQPAAAAPGRQAARPRDGVRGAVVCAAEAHA